MWKRLYKSTSASDIGTIFQLRNLINRKNIGNKPKNDVNAHEDFFHLLVESHVLAAAIEFLGMENIDDVPPVDIFPPTAWMLSQEERRDMLMSVCEAMVEEFVDIRTFEAKQDKQQPDKVQAYAKEVLSFGLLYKELVDAVRQGDGLRVLRWWKFMLLIFKATDRRNYSIEAFIIQAQYNYLLSPRQQHQLLYSRFINTHGLPGRNISCDL